MSIVSQLEDVSSKSFMKAEPGLKFISDYRTNFARL